MCRNLLTLFPVAMGEFGALYMQVYLLHCDLQPAEGAIQTSHQQTLGGSALLRGRWLVKNPQAEGLSPAEGSDPRHLSLHVTVRSCKVTEKFKLWKLPFDTFYVHLLKNESFSVLILNIVSDQYKPRIL